MNKVLDFLKEHKYLMVALVLVGISITLGVTYSNYIVTSNDHKAAEMYIGELKYSIEINGSTTNTLSVPTGETIIDVKVNNQNPVDTYYKLLYLKNSNLTVKYFESAYDLDDSNNTTKSYDKSNDSVASSNSKTIKLQITNNSTSSQNLSLSVKGGYITNTLSDITVPSTYSEITSFATNTYFCKTTNSLTQGTEYVNGQFVYRYMQDGKFYPQASSNDWKNIESDGWGVQLNAKTSTDAVTSKLCTYINNKAITSMSAMFSMSRASSIDLTNFNTQNVTDMSYIFCRNSSTLTGLSKFNTSNVTNMTAMFFYNTATALDLSEFNTSKVTNMSGMFANSQATTLDLSNFHTSNVIDMSQMFQNSKVTNLDLSNFDTTKVINMSKMFQGSEITIIDLSNFNTSKVTNMGYMFSGATSLKTIYVSDKFNVSNVTTSTKMFYNCTSLVGGAGTTYNSSYVDKTYAHIDSGTSNPGYFTDIANKPSEPNSFSTDSWPTIINAVKNNNIGKYNVGDTKEIDMGTYGTHTLRIANTSTPSKCSTTGFSQSACGFVLEFADIITTHNMNPSGTYKGTTYNYGWNVDGWPASSMYTFVNNDIYNALPSELRNAIIDTVTVSGHGSTSGETNFTSTDKLYLLAPGEVWSDWKTNTSSSGPSYDTAKELTRTLDYYTAGGVTLSNYSGAIKKNGTNAAWWWLRAARSNLDITFLTVTTSGNWGNLSAINSGGVAPAFRLG